MLNTSSEEINDNVVLNARCEWTYRQREPNQSIKLVHSVVLVAQSGFMIQTRFTSARIVKNEAKYNITVMNFGMSYVEKIKDVVMNLPASRQQIFSNTSQSKGWSSRTVHECGNASKTKRSYTKFRDTFVHRWVDSDPLEESVVSRYKRHNRVDRDDMPYPRNPARVATYHHWSFASDGVASVQKSEETNVATC